MKNIFVLISMLFVLQACELGVANGYVPTNEEIQTVKAGVDTKDSVREKFGRPSFMGENDNVWYYVAQYRTAIGPSPNREVQRRGLTVAFRSNGVVQSVNTFGMEDGQNVAVSNAETDSGGRKLSFWEQLWGSVGRFSAEDLLGN